MRTEYSNERKQWEPIPEPLLGALYTSNILAAPISVTTHVRSPFTHVLFLEKKNYQAYEKLFLLFLVSVQFSFRKKHILSF